MCLIKKGFIKLSIGSGWLISPEAEASANYFQCSLHIITSTNYYLSLTTWMKMKRSASLLSFVKYRYKFLDNRDVNQVRSLILLLCFALPFVSIQKALKFIRRSRRAQSKISTYTSQLNFETALLVFLSHKMGYIRYILRYY